jgi:hypothetical protein
MKGSPNRNSIQISDLTKAVLLDIMKFRETLDDVVLRAALTQAKRSDIVTANIRRALDEQKSRRY